MEAGSLVVVGSGIKAVCQATSEANISISQAGKVFYLVADPISEMWVRKLNSTAENLQDSYIEGKPRLQAYQTMVERILEYVRKNMTVCAVFYGHPGVFVFPSHEAIRLARAEGYNAHMLPGISTEDCLFADLGFDPARVGSQSFEATDFLINKRKFDPTSNLILWQIGVIGELGFKKKGYDLSNLQVLIDVLMKFYGAKHEVIVYEASTLVVCEPVIQRVSLEKLSEAKITAMSTLFVPPKPSVLDEKMLSRLKINKSDIQLPQR